MLPGPLVHHLHFAAPPGRLPQDILLTPYPCQFLFQSLNLSFNFSYHRGSDIKVDHTVIIAGEVCVGSVLMLEREIPMSMQVDRLLQDRIADGDYAPLCQGGVEMGEGRQLSFEGGSSQGFDGRGVVVARDTA